MSNSDYVEMVDVQAGSDSEVGVLCIDGVHVVEFYQRIDSPILSPGGFTTGLGERRMYRICGPCDCKKTASVPRAVVDMARTYLETGEGEGKALSYFRPTNREGGWYKESSASCDRLVLRKEDSAEE